MSLDQRARDTGVDVRDRTATIEPPTPAAIARRSRRGRVATGLAVVVLALAGVGLAVALQDDTAPSRLQVTHDPEPTPLDVAPGWQRILQADAGIDSPWSPDGVASDGDTVVLTAGADASRAEAWWSEDGLTWRRADTPEVTSTAFAIAIHGDVALLSGTLGPSHDPHYPFVWRSEDGGRSWTDAGVGLPAGNAFMAIRWLGGQWVALGRSALWVSEDGRRWEKVLDHSQGGPDGLLELPGERFGAYSHDALWVTDDPTDWGARREFNLQGYLGPIADGAQLALFQSYGDDDVQVVRSEDQGRTWVEDASYTGAHPSSAFQFGDLQLITGSDARERPTAWIASNDGWEAMPRAVQGSPDGGMGEVVEVDGRILVFGGGVDAVYLVYQP